MLLLLGGTTHSLVAWDSARWAERRKVGSGLVVNSPSMAAAFAGSGSSHGCRCVMHGPPPANSPPVTATRVRVCLSGPSAWEGVRKNDLDGRAPEVVASRCAQTCIPRCHRFMPCRQSSVTTRGPSTPRSSTGLGCRISGPSRSKVGCPSPGCRRDV